MSCRSRRDGPFLGRGGTAVRPFVLVGLCVLAAASASCTNERRAFFASCGASDECASNLCHRGVCSAACVSGDTCGSGVCVDLVCLPASVLTCATQADCITQIQPGPCLEVGCHAGRCLSVDRSEGTACGGGCSAQGHFLAASCKGRACLPTGKSQDCNDGDACTKDSCDAVKGCVASVQAGAPCDDGDGCTLGDACLGDGACAGKPDPCDDGNVCTGDGCAAGKCKHDPKTGSCDDGDLCTAADGCASGVCGSSPKMWHQVWHGGSGTDVGEAIVATGTMLAVGGTTATGDKDLQAFVRAYDFGGNLAWSTLIGGAGKEIGEGLAWTPDGFVLVGSTTAGSKGVDGLIARVDADGKFSWLQAIGDVGFDRWRDVVAHPVGGYVTTGQTQDASLVVKASLVHVDPDGKVVFMKAFAGKGTAVGEGVVAVAGGGFLLVGATGATSDPAAHTLGLLVRTDASGSPVWSQQHGTAGKTSIFHAAVTLPDGFAMAGASDAATGTSAMWLVRTGLLGNVLWERTFSQTKLAAARALVRTAKGFALFGDGVPADSGFADMVGLGTDGVGNFLYLQTAPTPGIDRGNSLALLADGRLAITGVVAAAGTGDGGDLWVARTNVWGFLECSQAGACLDLAVDACDDGDACTTDLCAPQAGCVHTALAEAAPCGSSACVPLATCQSGACKAKVTTTCNDGNPCTKDACVNGCTAIPLADGVACGGGKACKGGVCQ